MTVTFYTDQEYHEHLVEGPCLCAQRVPCEIWAQAMDGDLNPLVRAALADEANDACWMCKGTGCEWSNEIARPEVNLSNDNASVILNVLGFGTELVGQVTVAQFRRAYMRAINSDLSKFVRENEFQYAQVISQEAGSNLVTMERKLVSVNQGVNEEYIRESIERILKLVTDGGTVLCWD